MTRRRWGRSSRRGGTALAKADTSARQPGELAIDAEALRLAFKRLKGEDRKLLRMVLDGAGCVAVSRLLCISQSRASQRINGLLWQLRSSAELAAYLGVEPTPKPVRERCRHYPSVKRLAPARRVG